MKKNEVLFDFLQTGSLDGIWYWDLETGIDEWMSPRFWQILGYDPDEKRHLASEWQDLIFPEDLAQAIANFNKHCSDPSHPYDQIVRYRHKNGSTIWVRCRGIAIRNEEGKPVRMLGAHTDMTGQKQAEQELQKTNDALRKALEEIKTLQGIIPICAGCKKIRDDMGYWEQVESYISKHTEAIFSHGVCPECVKKLYPEFCKDMEVDTTKREQPNKRLQATLDSAPEP